MAEAGARDDRAEFEVGGPYAEHNSECPVFGVGDVAGDWQDGVKSAYHLDPHGAGVYAGGEVDLGFAHVAS